MATSRGLVRASHPGPTLAVTVFAAAWAGLTVGLPAGTVALVTLAVLLGQLSIGWSNDAVDAARDTAAGRLDKPVPSGAVRARTVAWAAGLALVGCAVASLALGWAAGTVHLVAVASGWAYNLGLKRTPLSPAPYALSFALLPAVATLAASEPAWPGWPVLAGGALLGVAAHFANTVADTESDELTGVRGLPQRLGPRRSMTATAALVAAAAAVLLVGRALPDLGPAIGWRAGVGGAALAAGVLLAVGGVAVPRRRAFPVTLAAVALVVAGFLVSPVAGAG